VISEQPGQTREAESFSNSASLRVSAGPLVGPLVCRVVSIVAVRADCPLNRLDDALLLCDAIAAHAPAHSPDNDVRVTVRAGHGRLQLEVSALSPGGARALIADAEVPGVGNVFEQVADSVRVVASGDDEMLLIELDFPTR
jgi:hypothetical protein